MDTFMNNKFFEKIRLKIFEIYPLPYLCYICKFVEIIITARRL